MATGSGIDIFYGGGEKFPPPSEFAARANATADLYDIAEKDFVAYWESEARRLVWFEPWQTALEGEAPDYKWFIGGKLNVSFNCLDRHVAEGKGTKVAFHWEGEPGDARTITYQELLDEVCRTANALKELGVRRGDRVAIYMPMIPELPIAMLACTRIGAAHTVVFGGFSADALREPDPGRRGQGGHHRRRRLPARRAGRAQAGRRRRAGGQRVPLGGEGAGGRRTGQETAMDARPRRLVGRRRSRARSELRARAHGRRGPPLHPLHVRHHGQAQGHRPHHRRLPRSARRRPTATSSTSSPATSTGAPPTSAGSPATATSCTGRSPTAPPA